MTRYAYRVEVSSAAAPEALFPVLADAPGWPAWAGPLVRQAGWQRQGDPPPGGVGAVRCLGAPPFVSRERIVEYEPPRRLAYVVSGLPVRDYRAEVELVATAAGTTIVWQGSFEPILPGTGPLLRAGLRAVVGGFARRLAVYAAR